MRAGSTSTRASPRSTSPSATRARTCPTSGSTSKDTSQTSKPTRWRVCCCWRDTIRVWREREREGKGRASANLARRAYLAAMTLDDGAANVEPQSQTDARAGLHVDAGGAAEGFPDMLQLPRRDAHAEVAHLHHGALALAPQPHLDRAVLAGILERVGEIVRHYLSDAVHIRHERERCGLNRERDPALGVRLTLPLDGVGHNARQFTGLWAELQLALAHA